MRPKRVHLEFLRVVAIWMVLFQHSKEYGSHLFLTTQNAAEYVFSLFAEILSTTAVPLFFMISGALLLGKTESLRTLFRKRVLRIAAVLFVTSAGYYIAIALTVPEKALNAHSAVDFLQCLFREPITAPLWYLYTYLAAMLMLPFLRPLAQKMQDKEYMYLFALHLFFVPLTAVAEKLIFRTALTTDLRLPLAMENSIFFMLMGYFLEEKLPQTRFTKRKAYTLSVAGLAMLLTGVLVTHIVCIRDGYRMENILDVLNRFTCLPAVALFFCAKTFPLPQRSEKLFLFLGGNVFGVYLLEKALRELLMPIAASLAPVVHTLPACFVWLAAVFAVGQLLTAVARKIPFIRKFI